MSVNSKADKTHKHTVRTLSLPGIQSGSKTATASYTSAPPPAAAGGVTPGQKALLLRAKAELKPLADPNQAPF